MSDHADTIREQADKLIGEISDAFPAVSSGAGDPMIDGLGALYELDDLIDALAARCDALENALRDLLDDMGIDDIDPRLRYVVAQITREVLADARAALAATDTTRDAGRPPKPSKPAWPTYAESGELVPPPGERQET